MPPRHSIYPPPQSTSTSTSSSSSQSAHKTRQLTHLHASLATLSAHLADTENLLRMTAVQAESMRGLGGWCGGLFMSASKILGEESSSGVADGTNTTDGTAHGPAGADIGAGAGAGTGAGQDHKTH